MSSGILSRRDFLRILALAGGGLLVSCTQPHLQTPAPTSLATRTVQPTPTSAPLTPPPPRPSATPLPTLPANIQEKIDTVIILLQENHSFDSLFAGYPGAISKPAPNVCPDVIKVAVPEGGTSVAYYCSYTDGQVPDYWQLAQSFTLCDRYYSEVRLPSFPNYMMLTSAETRVFGNPSPPYKCPNYCVDVVSIANRLDDKSLTWHDYGGLFANIKSLQGRSNISYKSMDGFFQDAADGRLPNVSWIGAFLVGGVKTSGHPPGNICDAENFAVQVVNAVMAGPQWSRALLVLTWDEWGNFYEHTVPPVVERLANGRPFRYGFRVPCLVISPYAQAGKVLHTQLSHVSTLRTIEEIYGLEPLNSRDGTANSLLDCLNLSQAPITPFRLPERTCSSS